jgi:hypothetical protein
MKHAGPQKVPTAVTPITARPDDRMVRVWIRSEVALRGSRRLDLIDEVVETGGAVSEGTHQFAGEIVSLRKHYKKSNVDLLDATASALGRETSAQRV